MVEEITEVPDGLTTEGLLGRRYLARAIDFTLLTFLAGTLWLAPSPFVTNRLIGALIMFTLWLLTAVGYGALFESSAWQATPGKRLLGLRVYDARGCRLKPSQAAMRAFFKDGPFILIALIPGFQFLNLPLLIAHLVVLHRSPVSQAIHDRLAATWVAAPETTTQLHLT